MSSRLAWPSIHAVFWFTPNSRNITTEEMPLEDVNTRNIAAIQIRRSSFVACSGVFVVTVSLRSDGKLTAATSLSALIQARANRRAAERSRTQAAAVGTEPIIDPYSVFQEEPGVTLRGHSLPDVADEFQFCDHEQASFLWGKEDIGCFQKIRSDDVLAGRGCIEPSYTSQSRTRCFFSWIIGKDFRPTETGTIS